jgi:Zn-dependent protease with chaperone function
MRLRAFKSVLAHEYGHFRNEDTAGGGFALAVRRSLTAMAIELARTRLASPLNPAWWFVRGFGRAYFGISQGASRLQETLADRWAAFAYGSAAFAEGLRHVVERDVRFSAHVEATLDEVVKQKLALPNLYAFVPATPKDGSTVDSAITKALEKIPTPYDSHPRPADRIALVMSLAVAEPAPAGEGEEDEDVWALFADRSAVEGEMTAEVRARLARVRGVVVPAE